ncbi:MAG: sugar ABC transporter permease [Chloroflexota bacterium]
MQLARTRQGTATARAPMSPVVREGITGWLFALPWILGFLVFTVGPMLFAGYTSFTKYNITTAPKWIGLDNYTNLFKDDWFYKSLGNTFWIVVVKVPIVIVVSLAIAMLLNINLPGARFFRTIFYMPNVLSGVAAVFLWLWILSPDGLVNNTLEIFGLKGPSWWADPNWTKPGLVVMGMWWIGGNILIFLAGLKGIPEQLYEASSIDGATGWTRFRYITLPLLSPTIFFTVVTGIIGAFQIFTTAFIITSSSATGASGGTGAIGGPGQSLLFYVLYLYNRAFGKTGVGFQMGYASAMAWILFIIILVVTLFQLWLSRRWVYYET